MKVNRYSWNKKILKLNRRLTKFSNAISTEDILLINRFIKIIEVFQKELKDWKINIYWRSELEKGNTMDFTAEVK